MPVRGWPLLPQRTATEGFTVAFEASMALAIGAFIGCAVLSLALPRTAVAGACERYSRHRPRRGMFHAAKSR